ncbi:MAG: YXWGXW repeat-containing protein [Burkholderiales bacterium]|nr:YXWGXW repeat-containing protein [Burkholderiales bacterium]
MLKEVLLTLATAGLLAGGAPALAAARQDARQAAKKADRNKQKVVKQADLVVSVKPPSGQWEAKPPPADGWVWRAGFYEWTGERFAWKPGEWILDKPGMDFRQFEWVEAGQGKWKLEGGDWVAEKHS